MSHHIAIDTQRRLIASRFWGSLTRKDFDRVENVAGQSLLLVQRVDAGSK